MMDQILSIAGNILGGLGLFLLAVSMITDGLKLAAGQALTNILGTWTKTTGRGIFSGLLITALVQSSSAVTVATIGFVNAALLTMPQALGVIFGSNIGTTMTGWLVAAIGFNIKIDAFALPMLGLGMLFKLLRPQHTLGSIGIALAGFGLFFIGIDILKSAFETIVTQSHFNNLTTENNWSLFSFLWIGFLITVLTQSSSAAIALILTATTGGLIPLDAAAAMVIGSNLGTTSTAMFSVIGATPNAKRVALAHIVFNLITGVIALSILPILLSMLHNIEARFSLESSPAIILALFHTIFNLLGVLIFWPLTGLLAKLLLQLFQTTEEIESHPKYLDKTILVSPTLALNALSMELQRINKIVHRMSAGAISTELSPGKQLSVDHANVLLLLEKVEDFTNALQKSQLTDKNVQAITEVYKASRYLSAASNIANRIAREKAITRPLKDENLSLLLSEYQSKLVDFLFQKENRFSEDALDGLEREIELLDQMNEALRQKLKQAVTQGRINLQQLTTVLDFLGRCHRLSKNMYKFYEEITILSKEDPTENAKMEQ